MSDEQSERRKVISSLRIESTEDPYRSLSLRWHNSDKLLGFVLRQLGRPPDEAPSRLSPRGMWNNDVEEGLCNPVTSIRHGDLRRVVVVLGDD